MLRSTESKDGAAKVNDNIYYLSGQNQVERGCEDEFSNPKKWIALFHHAIIFYVFHESVDDIRVERMPN